MRYCKITPSLENAAGILTVGKLNAMERGTEFREFQTNKIICRRAAFFAKL